ncbi:MAG: hypothetical protein ACYSSI_13165, partial [Planctomycetota bacterium]
MKLQKKKNIFPNATERLQPGLNAITIDVIKSANGLGDIVNAVRLAEGLKKTGYVETIRVLFESVSDLHKLRRILPDLPEDIIETEYFERDDGVIFINGEKTDIESIIKNSKLTIISQLMLGGEAFGFGGEAVPSRESAINIYLEEYDAVNPKGLMTRLFDVVYVFDRNKPSKTLPKNKIYKDKTGNLHIVLPTGFHSDIGIHILEHPGGDIITNKPGIIASLIKNKQTLSILEGITDNEWGLVYYDNFRDYLEVYEEPLLTAIKEEGIKSKEISIFDIS